MLVKDLKKAIANDEIAATIISLVLSCPKSQVFTLEGIPNKIAHKCIKIANEYKNGKPIAYQTKKWFFYDFPLYINRSVLIPRFDTEILAETVIKAAKDSDKILDLCTGSGCIAVAIAKHTKAKIYASDISKKALRIASKNACLNKADIDFIKSDLFRNIDNIKNQFDIIVSNPPYIKAEELGIYDKSTLHEPRLALDGGIDGMEFYRKIVAEAPDYLAPNGLLALEIGDNTQAYSVKSLLQNASYHDINIIKDISGNYRVITARMPRTEVNNA